MYNYKITVEYDGTNFVGWQQQANGVSVQSSLQDSVFKLSGEKVVVYGAGRTDAGVHAYGQVASFVISKKISTDVIRDGLNQHLRPLMISVLKAEEVDNDYEYQRRNFYQLIERGQDAIDGILELAKESETPRSYEVAGNMIKQVADVTEKLGELQLKMQKLKEVPSNAPKNVTNALFVGSTSELQKMLKGK